jgi:hypothetical protein
VYYLKDLHGEKIKFTFYPQELQPVKYPLPMFVEKVLKREGKKAFVRWVGFDESFDSWIAEKDIR